MLEPCLGRFQGVRQKTSSRVIVLGSLRRNDDFLFYTESVARFFFFFAQRNFAWPFVARPLFFFSVRTRQGYEALGTPVQG